MKILILGSGAREHAIAWKLSESVSEPIIYIAPGNAGTLQLGENIPLDPNDFNGIKTLCIDKEIEMVIVGPEEPLVNGIFDFFKNDPQLSSIMITGPSASGARLEGSKAFSKSFMQRHGIPTAGYREFDSSNFEEGVAYLQNHSCPIVLKADGLAAGKGVTICKNAEEAAMEFTSLIQQEKLGASGKKVVVEEFLDGVEVSMFVCTDGKNYVLLPEAKDYKQIGEGNTGPNTGGMGAISPVPFVTESFKEKVIKTIIEPTLNGLRKDGIDYKGFLFFGLIKVDEEPFVIEYNCRLGDPETEVILLRLKNDLVELICAMYLEKLDEIEIEISKSVAATMVAVSEGYPGVYEKGKIVALNYLKNPNEIKEMGEFGGAEVFHAGTRKEGDKILTNGGRVLAVAALTNALGESVELCQEILQQIYFDGMYYRSDIGFEFIE